MASVHPHNVVSLTPGLAVDTARLALASRFDLALEVGSAPDGRHRVHPARAFYLPARTHLDTKLQNTGRRDDRGSSSTTAPHHPEWAPASSMPGWRVKRPFAPLAVDGERCSAPYAPSALPFLR